MKKVINNTGQNLLEYTLLIGIVLLIVLSMSPMIKRGTQGMIKTVADQIGEQVNADQFQYDQSGMGYKELFGDGGLVSQTSNTRTRQNKRLVENVGDTRYQFSDTTEIHATTDLSLGHTDE